jgi:serine/threonine-protein kinase PRP4
MFWCEKNGNGNGDTPKSDSDSYSDDSDMFGSPSSEDKARKEKKKQTKKENNKYNKNKHSSTNGDEHKKQTGTNSRQDGFDDSDGYYKASIGETMELEVLGGSPSFDEITHNESEASTLQLRVLGVIGKGVFSSVLKCSTTMTSAAHGNGIPSTISLANSSNSGNTHGLPSEVAIKCIRSNETMSKAALDEMKFLIRLRNSSGIVPLLLPSPAAQSNNNPNYVPPPIDFKGHTVLIFPYLPYNLRDVLQKFGKGVGLSLTAVKNYYFQLLSAATHLQKHRVIHADIKPDNILVTSDFSKVVLADFGSAFESRAAVVQNNEGNDEAEGGAAAAAVAASATGRAATHEAVTPYLVSRFYRAPEIIMGLQPLTHAIDLWSFAVTAAELFLGKVLLKGANNNDMLYVMMELLVSRIRSIGVLFSY